MATRAACGLTERIEVVLDDLDATTQARDMDLPDNRLHQLKGQRRGQWSVTISDGASCFRLRPVRPGSQR
ncbi:MAG: hypothetical protein OSB03_10000 [Vicinamibacterales bacterium]|jgi:plasmid maintenance system killer protein|nr:hypothetical protein [Vicinamibacterales bacterium]